MSEPTFLIKSIETERRPNGNSRVIAACSELEEWITIEVPSTYLENENLIRQELMVVYDYWYGYEKEYIKVQVGSIL